MMADSGKGSRGSALAERAGGASKIRLGSRYFMQYLAQETALLTGMGAPRPSMLCGLVNWECNFRCFFCAHPYYAARPVLDFGTWETVLKDLRQWLGVFRMNFLGGEPFLRDDFVDILSCSRRLGVMTGITSNGSLIDRVLAETLGKLKLFSIGISLDGATRETHETIRGCPGQFEAVMNALTCLRSACGKETHIILRTIIMEDNLDELTKLVALVKKLDLTGVVFQPLDPQPVLDGKPPDGVPDTFDYPAWAARYQSHFVRQSDVLNRRIDELMTLKLSGAPILNSPASLEHIRHHIGDPFIRRNSPCAVGVRNLMILPNGDVHTCCDTVGFRSIGNVSDMGIRDIWKSPRAAERRRQTRRCRRTCLFFSHAQRSLLENARMFLKFVRG